MRKLQPKLEPLKGPSVRKESLVRLIGPGLAPLPEHRRVPTEDIEVDPNQPRQHFDTEKLRELAEDLRHNGFIHPLTVKEIGHERYLLITGERRLRAARQAEIPMVPVNIYREIEEPDIDLMRLRENLQREDLSPLETAQGLHRYKERTGKTWAEIAQEFGWKENTVLQKIRLLNAPQPVKALIEGGVLTPGHYSRIASQPDEKQVQLAEKTVEEKWTVKELSEAIKAEAVPATAPARSEEMGLSEQSSNGGVSEPVIYPEGLFGQSSSTWKPPSPMSATPVYSTIKMTVTVPGEIHGLVAAEMERLKIKAYADYLRMCLDEHLRSKGMLPDQRSSE
jgi:ParB family chromosome partitioning protein